MAPCGQHVRTRQARKASATSLQRDLVSMLALAVLLCSLSFPILYIGFVFGTGCRRQQVCFLSEVPRSLLFNRVQTTTAWNILRRVLVRIFLLLNTRSLVLAAEALPIRETSLVLRLQLYEIVLPRFVKSVTFSSGSLPSMFTFMNSDPFLICTTFHIDDESSLSTFCCDFVSCLLELFRRVVE